jgi:hypothetical protein
MNALAKANAKGHSGLRLWEKMATTGDKQRGGKLNSKFLFDVQKEKV